MKSMAKHFLSRIAVAVCGLALVFSFNAAAQNLKPAKDKATKKYGYKDGKNWVIAPSFDDAKKFKDGFAEVEIGGHVGVINESGELVLPAIYDNVSKFDRNGYCEVMQKSGSTKLYGIVDNTGRTVIPVEAKGVEADRGGKYMYAKYAVSVPGFNTCDLWGVYDLNGQEIFEPQFSYTPSFYEKEVAIAKSGVTGLYGMIDGNGEVRKPFKFLDIRLFSGGFKALGTDLTHYVWSLDLRDSQSLRQPGAIKPYDPMDDPVRVAAWHRGPIGRRLYSNVLRKFELHNGFRGTQAACTMLPLNWGFGRFVRLEPCEVSGGTPEAMRFGSGNSWYTLKAILYEPDGTYVEEVCSRGWIEALCDEGAIYNADGREKWLVLADPNALALPAVTMNITGYRPVNHDDVYQGLDITIADISKLRGVYEFANRCKRIYEAENVGVSSYIPRIPSERQAKAEFMAEKAPIFHYRFHMGEVVNCKVARKDGVPEIRLSPDLTCIYKDKIEDPSYTLEEGPEVIFWGPNNARTVKLSLEAKPRSDKYTADDVHGTDYSYSLALNMYEEDGRWLRTLAVAPWADFVKDGIIVFERLGVAMISPFSSVPKRPGYHGHNMPSHGNYGNVPPHGTGSHGVPPQGNYGNVPPQGNYSNVPPQGQNGSVPAKSQQGMSQNRGYVPPQGYNGNVHPQAPGAAGSGAPQGPNAPQGPGAPAPGMQPLPHTLSALEAALRY
jgi:hypothetical protein